MGLVLKISLLLAVIFTGILCGASLDQSLKQLPARRRIGAVAFSAYARAADLKNGIYWYAVTGIGSAIITIFMAVTVWKTAQVPNLRLPATLAAVLAAGQIICTSRAAPIYLRQKI
jgi:hypothetical protein